MSNVGFRIFPIPKRLDKGLLEHFKYVVTPHISDNMNRLSALGADLTPYHKRGKLVGTAITVKTRPGDNLMVHKAIDIAESGDVIVVDAGGELTNAIVGEIMLRLAQKKGLHGFVINGAIRDVKAFQTDVFPIYARGVTHRGPYKEGPGEINSPIAINGCVIFPGDIVVGDEDGVAIVPANQAEKLLERIKKQQILESKILDSIEKGTIDRNWVDETLRQKGCEFLDVATNKV